MDDHELLVRIDERMDTVIKWQTEHMAKCHIVHADHEGRLRGVESWKYKEAGALGVLTVLANWVWNWLTGGPR
mgnify:FL=1